MSLADWAGVPLPRAETIGGDYVRLVPLAHAHGPDLFAAASAAGAEDRFRYLPNPVPANPAEIEGWIAGAAATPGMLFFAVLDKESGRALGRQALMRMDPANGVIEIGHIMWGPEMARTRRATEAFFLCAEYVFGLGYRRFEWKCDNANLPSKQAALRFGFQPEGVFRQHMVIKGRNRDTAWFAILDQDWPRLRAEYRRWLEAGNFGPDGAQLSRLDCRALPSS